MVHEHKSTAIRRKEITRAARRLIIKRGAEHVTIRGIAEEVGISEAAIYRHFRSKKDILRLLLDDIEHNLMDDVASEHTGGLTALQTLDAVLRHHLSAIEQRRGIRFQVIAEIISLGDKCLNERASQTVEEYLDCLEQLLSDGIRTGEIRSDTDRRGMAMLLFSIVQGVVNVWALNNYNFDPMTRYEPMWRIVRQGLEMHRPG